MHHLSLSLSLPSLSLARSLPHSTCSQCRACARAVPVRELSSKGMTPLREPALARRRGKEPRAVRRMGAGALQGMTASAALCFLHLFCGPRDKLGEAVVAEAARAGLEVTVEAYDLCKGHDLTDPNLVREILEKAKAGKYQGAHSGFPCTTFTRLRWRPEEGQPGPVRSRQHIYGLPSNTRAQQDEADRGTLLAATTIRILEAVEWSQAREGTSAAKTVSIENPPETNHPFAGSAYYLPEIVEWISGPGIEFADFNNCVYADPAKGEQPCKKPQRFVGKIPGLAGLTATCSCGRGAFHPRVVGGAAAKDSAGYPISLCHAYAQAGGQTVGVGHATILQAAGRATRRGARPGHRGGPVDRGIGSFWRAPGHQEGQARPREPRGRRWNVEASLVPGPRSRLEGRGARDRPAVRQVRGKGALEAHFGVCSRPASLQLKSLLHYDSPVNVALLEAWSRQASDPDQAVLTWLREGAPLGANVPIPSVGIFPSKEEDLEAWEEAEAETQAWEARQNYGSFTANPGDSEEEMNRPIELGYVVKISEEQAQSYFTAPVISKLGLLVKPRADGSVKRRVIVDALRSGANRRARCPERIVLPRPQDVYTMAADLKAQEPQLLEWYRGQGPPNQGMGRRTGGGRFDRCLYPLCGPPGRTRAVPVTGGRRQELLRLRGHVLRAQVRAIDNVPVVCPAHQAIARGCSGRRSCSWRPTLMTPSQPWWGRGNAG